MKRLSILGCLVLAACGGQKLDLGGTRTDSVTSTEASDAGSGATANAVYDGVANGVYTLEDGIPGASPCTVPDLLDGGIPLAPASASLDSLVGTWSGEFAGADGGVAQMAVVLSLAQPDAGPATGTITFGSGPLPAVDPDHLPQASSTGGDLSFPYPGFPYTTTRLAFDGQVVSFTLALGEFWKSWCGLQTSYSWAPNIPGGCGCAPDWPLMTSSNGTYEIAYPGTNNWVGISVDGTVYVACNEDVPYGPHCSCSAAGCTVDMSASDATFQLTLTPAHLDGTVSIPPSNQTEGMSDQPIDLVQTM